MPHPHKAKGDRAEREAAALLTELTGLEVVRRYNLGTHDDTGDLLGLPYCVVQVCDWQDPARAMREKIPQAEEQRLRARVPFAATMIRRRGGKFVIAMSPEQFAALYLAWLNEVDSFAVGYLEEEATK